MSNLPSPPPEPEACRDISVLPQQMQDKVAQVIQGMSDKGWVTNGVANTVPSETYRSDERQKWLYGFGRTWDDGRGIVTNVPSAMTGWHFFKLAIDFTHRVHGSDAPAKFWSNLGVCIEAAGLTWGDDWDHEGTPDDQRPNNQKFCDKPHAQWYTPGMHTSPSTNAAALFESDGIDAVWKAVNAE